MKITHSNIGLNRRAGFTLIELFIALGILTIIAAIALPFFNRYVKEAKRADGIAALNAAWKAEKVHYALWKQYSQTIDPGVPCNSDSGNCMGGQQLGKLEIKFSQKPKYNLVFGCQDSTCNANPNVKFVLGDLPEMSDLPTASSANRAFGFVTTTSFAGLNSDPETILVGAIGNVDQDSSLDIIAIDQNGMLLQICDDVTDKMHAENYVSSRGRLPDCSGTTGAAPPSGPGSGTTTSGTTSGTTGTTDGHGEE